MSRRLAYDQCKWCGEAVVLADLWRFVFPDGRLGSALCKGHPDPLSADLHEVVVPVDDPQALEEWLEREPPPNAR